VEILSASYFAWTTASSGYLSPESGGITSSFFEDAFWKGGSTDCGQNGLKLSYMKWISSSCSRVTLHMLRVAFLVQRFASAYFLQETQTKNVTVQLQMTIKMASYILSFFPQERQRPFVFDLAFWLVHLSLSTVCVSCDWLKAEITEWLEYTPAKTFVRFIFQVCFHVARFTCLFHFNIILFTIILSEISWIGELEINAVAKLLLVRSSTDKERPLEISPFDVCGILMAVLKGDILYTEVVFVHERPPGTKCKW